MLPGSGLAAWRSWPSAARARPALRVEVFWGLARGGVAHPRGGTVLPAGGGRGRLPAIEVAEGSAQGLKRPSSSGPAKTRGGASSLGRAARGRSVGPSYGVLGTAYDPVRASTQREGAAGWGLGAGVLVGRAWDASGGEQAEGLV
jgi:hypothetical protein